MKRLAPLTMLLLGLAASCQTKTPEVEKQVQGSTAAPAVDEGCAHMEGGSCSASPAAPAPPRAGTKSYGARLGSSPEVALAQVLTDPDRYAGKEVIVEGLVKRACSKRGCWMELVPNEASNALGCRVKFKDYGFLVPTDSAGSSARLEGTVLVTKVKKAAVDHYEQEGAQFPKKAADGSANEVRFVATGVELTRS